MCVISCQKPNSGGNFPPLISSTPTVSLPPSFHVSQPKGLRALSAPSNERLCTLTSPGNSTSTGSGSARASRMSVQAGSHPSTQLPSTPQTRQTLTHLRERRLIGTSAGSAVPPLLPSSQQPCRTRNHKLQPWTALGQTPESFTSTINI